MNPAILATDYLYSEFGSEPEMAELVELFVSEMSAHVERLQGCVDRGDWSALGRMAHQLKGAAGGYGFHQLTEPAHRLELSVRQDRTEEEILASAHELLGLCRRLRSGRAWDNSGGA